MTPAAPRRNVAIAGATGLIGSQLLQRLCADPAVGAVHALARRPLGMEHAKLTAHQVDFSALPALPPLDELYLALGTTIKAAGSQAAFRALDLDANLAVARAAHAAGARRIGLVSALGANAGSRIFYNRIKGELEQALAALELDALVIARPSMLAGDRATLGQPTRPGEIWASQWSRRLGPLLPAGWRAIAAADVAAALARQLPTARGRVVLTSAAMQGASQRGD